MKKQTSLLILSYALLRVLSFYFQPGSIFNSALTFALIMLTAYLIYKKNELGWFIVAGEFILGGTGNYLQLAGLSLRSWLFLVSMGLFIFRSYKDKSIKDHHETNKWFTYPLSLLFLVIGGAILRGQIAGHSPKLIQTEIVPYLFFLYYFPLKELLKSDKFKKFAIYALAAAIAGNLIFILFTFAAYSTGIFQLQDAYYHWFRDIANGKITDLGLNFYRIVLNEHLLLIPVLFWQLHSVIARPRRGEDEAIPLSSVKTFASIQEIASLRFAPFAMTGVLLVILSINLTRIYIVALIIGLLVLFSREFWKRWLIISASVLIFFFASFTAIHLIASHGQSLGWEIFGVRLQSIANPQLEKSSLSRMLLLPKIFENIKRHPILGSGLGDTVTVYSPVINQTITTPQFDWGYLEIWDELGFIGLLAWVSIIASLFVILRRYNLLWQTASLASLLVINITSPALFHVLGVIWITFLFVLSHPSKSVLQSV